MSTTINEKFMGSNLRVRLDDSRVLDGILTAIDPFGNLLLSNSFEYSPDKFEEGKVHKRSIGLVSIPKTGIKSIAMEKKNHAAIFKE